MPQSIVCLFISKGARWKHQLATHAQQSNPALQQPLLQPPPPPINVSPALDHQITPSDPHRTLSPNGVLPCHPSNAAARSRPCVARRQFDPREMKVYRAGARGSAIRECPPPLPPPVAEIVSVGRNSSALTQAGQLFCRRPCWAARRELRYERCAAVSTFSVLTQAYRIEKCDVAVIAARVLS